MENLKIDPARLPELYEAICELHGPLELAEVIDRTLQAAIKLTKAERAFIQFPDRYSLYALPKLAAESERIFGAALKELVYDVVQNRQGILIADTQNEPRFAVDPQAASFTLRTLLIVPLQVPNELLGVLIVDRTTSAGTFTADDLATLAFFARWASMAIHNAQLTRRQGTFIAEIARELARLSSGIELSTNTLLTPMAGQPTDAQKTFLEVTLDNVNRMGNLVNDLFDVGRIEARRIWLKAESVDVKGCAEQVVNKLRLAISEKHHTITVCLEDSPFLRADPHRLARIMAILLDNAIKYTPIDGKIDVSAKIQGTYLKISIRDTGIGIPDKDQSRISTKLFRSSNAREYSGYGLSLYIAKNLIELMGGTIGFESEPGKGSTFWFTLPIAEQTNSVSP